MGITRPSFFVRTGFVFFVARLPTDAMVLSRVLNQAWPPVAATVGIRPFRKEMKFSLPDFYLS